MVAPRIENYVVRKADGERLLARTIFKRYDASTRDDSEPQIIEVSRRDELLDTRLLRPTSEPDMYEIAETGEIVTRER